MSFSSTAARDLLRAFDVCDDDPQARAFLVGLITSGMAPPDEVAKLCHLAKDTIRDGGDGATQAVKRRKKRRRRRRSSSVPEAEQQTQRQASVEAHAAVKDDDDAAGGKVSHFFAAEAEQTRDGPPAQTTIAVVVTTRTTVLWPASRGGGSDGDGGNGIDGNEQPDAAPPAAPSTPSPRKALRTTASTPTTVSPFFASSSPTPRTPHTPGTPSRRRRRRRPGGCVSGLPVPPLAAPAFGLVQERLAADPFWLLVALVFLTRVAGRVSLPVFWDLRACYPTPAALAAAEPAALAAPMRHLGMAAVRAVAIQRLARRWLAQPPRLGVCTVVRGYGDGDGDGNDSDAALSEIGHITQGPYAIDSWRIFCRDIFLGRSTDWKGDGGQASDGGGTFQPEWMRVRPRDKELRACLRWMWMREGWEWDPATGDRTVLRETLRQAVDQGRVDYDDEGALQIVDAAEEE